MKKILSMLLVLAMLASSVLTVAAVQTPATFTLSSDSCHAGETIELAISLKSTEAINSIALADFTYDEEALEFVGFSEEFEPEIKSQLALATMKPDSSKMAITIALASAVTLDNKLCTMTFKVKADAPEGTYTIDAAKSVIKNKSTVVASSVVPAEITVSKKAIEGLDFEGDEFTYDGTEKTLAVTGAPADAIVTYESLDFDADGKAIDAGTYNIKATVKKDGYKDWTKEAVLKINPKPISVTGLTANNKVYDGTNVATLSGGTIEGLVARDGADQYCNNHQDYRIKYHIPETGTFADANAGNNKAVTIATITLDGCSKDNYVLTQPTGLTANITKAPITVTAKDVTVKTGSGFPSAAYGYDITSGALIGSDTLSGYLETNCTSTDVAGEFAITQGTLTAGPNYDLTFVNGKFLVVDKEIQNVTVDGVVTEKTYGDNGFKVTVTPDATSGLNNFTFASSNTNVAEIDTDGNVTVKNAGTTTITVKEAGNAEYAPFEKSWTLTVNKVNVTITADNKSKKVGSADPELTYTVEGSLVGNDAVTGALERVAGEDAGTYDITIGTLTINDNYNINFINGTFTITDKTEQNIVVAGTVTEAVYGDAGFRVIVTPDSVSGLNNFTLSSSDKNVATIDETGYVTIKNAGTTTISVIEEGNAEYASFEKTWTLTVNKVKVTITADNIVKKIGQNDPELTYSLTGTLVGNDAVTGNLARTPGEEIGKYDIVIGTLAISDNYEINFIPGIFEILDKELQTITIANIGEKTYGDEPFALDVTPDSASGLNTFTYEIDNTEVAQVSEDGTVTINGVGKATITVHQAGNADYAATKAMVELVVNPAAVTVTAIDMAEKAATIEGILDADASDVELDFDNIKTTVISSEKATVDGVAVIISTIKATNFVLKGEKAKNYVVEEDASLETTVITETISDNLTPDENVTVEAAPVDDKTIIVTDVVVAPEAEVQKVTIDVTAMEDTKVNTVALPTTAIDTIIKAHEDAVLEIILKDGSAENKASTISLNKVALDTVYAAVYASVYDQGIAVPTISISVNHTIKDQLDDAQKPAFDSVSTKSPVVYTLSIVDSLGNELTAESMGGFGNGGFATVKLPYVKPAGNGTIVVKYLDDFGNLTNIVNPLYDAAAQLVSVTLGHFSEYLIYTEPEANISYGGGVKKCTVKFATNGGNTIKSVTVNKNAVVAEPVAPTKEGFVFDGWYADKALTTPYDFASKVTNSITIYAKWKEIEKEDPTVSTKLPFSDVAEKDWYYDSVKYVFDNKLMLGTTDTTFAPNTTLTRAMLVTVLYRIEGEPATNRSIPFADVDMGSWYGNAVSWAKQNNIVNGMTETEFAPDNNITREQIATIMFRYAQFKGLEAITLEENLHFADANEISEYAVSAMNWAVGTGLMKGKTETTINPKDNATRAEIATILQRFIESK